MTKDFDNPRPGASWPESKRADAINELVTYFHAKSKAAGWWADPKTGEDLTKNPYVVATKLMLVVTELSEAMEGLRKDLMDDKLPHRKMGEVELGDALIRIADLAGALGYDLGGATVEKDAFNTVRPDHQVGNRMLAGGKAY
jgi:NTP pyrophosphatase (non-canonical NTP hydrolase)